MKIRSVFTLAVLLSAGIVTMSFTSPPATKFKVDTKASTIEWTGKKVTGQHNGNILLSSGELVVDGKSLKQGSFEVDVTSLTVTDVKDGSSNQKLVGHLKSGDFFGVEKFPKANFVISTITQKSEDEYSVKGQLTIKGITNEIEFPATIKNDGKQLTASAKIVIDRTKFDIKYSSKSFFENLGDKVIYDDFELDLRLVANAQNGI